MAAETAMAPPTEEAPAAPPSPAASGKPAKAKKPEKSKGAEKGKKGAKPSKGAEPDGDGPSIAAHPRAVRAVARAKGWGGLAGFLLGGYLSLPTNTLAEAGLRALVAGVACYVVTWAGAVFLWRRLVMLEIKGREQQLLAASVASSSAAMQRRELPPGPAGRPGQRTA